MIEDFSTQFSPLYLSILEIFGDYFEILCILFYYLYWRPVWRIIMHFYIDQVTPQEIFILSFFQKLTIIIIAFSPDKKKTTIRELIIENQWISTSLMPRYTSHLLAQLTSDCFHSTEYRKRRLVPFGLTNCGLASLGKIQVFPSNVNWDVSIDRASTSNPTTLNSFL